MPALKRASSNHRPRGRAPVVPTRTLAPGARPSVMPCAPRTRIRRYPVVLWTSLTSVKTMPGRARACSRDRRRCAPGRPGRRRDPRRWPSGWPPRTASSALRIVGRDPARQLEFGARPSSTSRPYSASSRTCSTSSCSGPTTPTSAGEPSVRAEHLHHALLGQLLQRLLQLLGLHRVGQPHAAQDFRREARHADEVEVLALGQRVADAQRAVVGNADHVAGIGLVGERAVLGEEELRRVQR